MGGRRTASKFLILFLETSFWHDRNMPTLTDNVLATLNEAITACTLCPRLVHWREQVAQEKVKRFADWDYWGKPVPSFGSTEAGLLIVGLAPAAHGANRTGRMFTGDNSGHWLYRALHKAGFASQAESVSADDGLFLMNTRISAVCHCAPPANKPLPSEVKNCRGYLLSELNEMPNLKVVLALGKLAFDAVLQVYAETGHTLPKPKPVFGHNVTYTLPDGKILIGSYHPSQQNTFTGKLTEPMLDAVFTRIQQELT